MGRENRQRDHGRGKQRRLHHRCPAPSRTPAGPHSRTLSSAASGAGPSRPVIPRSTAGTHNRGGGVDTGGSRSGVTCRHNWRLWYGRRGRSGRLDDLLLRLHHLFLLGSRRRLLEFQEIDSFRDVLDSAGKRLRSTTTLLLLLGRQLPAACSRSVSMSRPKIAGPIASRIRSA